MAEDLDQLIERTEGLILSMGEDSPKRQSDIYFAHETFMETYDHAIDALAVYLVQVKRAVDFLESQGSKLSGKMNILNDHQLSLKTESQTKWKYFKSYQLELRLSKSGDFRYDKELLIKCNFDKDSRINDFSFTYNRSELYKDIEGNTEKVRTLLSKIALQALEEKSRNEGHPKKSVLKVPMMISEIPYLVISALTNQRNNYHSGNVDVDQTRISLDNLEFPDLKLE